MNQLVDLYLTSAFRDLEHVSIAGIGTFSKVRRAAYADTARGVIHPPAVELEFEPLRTAEPGFSAYLTRETGIERERADQMELALAGLIRERLEHTGEFRIPDAGTLRLDASGMLRFEAIAGAHSPVSAEYFGLQPVIVQQGAAGRPLFPPTTTDMIQESHEAPSLLSPWVWRLAALALILGALAVTAWRFNPWRQSRAPLVQVGAPALQPAPPAPQPAPEAAAQPSTPETATEAADSQPAAVPAAAGGDLPAGANQRTRAAAPSAGNTSAGPAGSISVLDTAAAYRSGQRFYHLIAGSFTSLEAARKFQTQMTAEGYTAIIVASAPGVQASYRVSIFRSSDRKTAEAFAEKQKVLGKNSGWIYEELP
ncbi:MAG: SPOR domain-containing protein [Bacteroidia bacterium]|nr:SPOR domain-containing protein [Bacteroidia bacterium]